MQRVAAFTHSNLDVVIIPRDTTKDRLTLALLHPKVNWRPYVDALGTAFVDLVVIAKAFNRLT